MQEEAPIIIVGAGPVGMLLAYQLDRLGVPYLIAEQNLETTKWPKMDLTNCRSMEILRYLGLADDYRAQPGSVPRSERFDTQFVTQINPKGRLLSSWELPSSLEQDEHARAVNDGRQPAEAEQRCSQIIFEAWLKNILLERPNITARFGWKYISHQEDKTGVTATFTDLNGNTHVVRGKYLVGCDGGGSRVRRTAGITMRGGPMPIKFHLVHFKSRDLSKHFPVGRFWHIFAAHGGFIIDQDNKDTFTAHFPVHLLDPEETDPREIVYAVLGNTQEKYRIEIDEILVDSEWTPNFSVADQYQTDGLRVFLAGDAAHRSPPHGGYGMNSGVIDAIDLGWRLASVIKGYGGNLLLSTYTIERRPMMVRALVRSHRHLLEHIKLAQIFDSKLELLDEPTAAGEALRQEVHAFLQESGAETRDRGIEFDLRYYHSPIIYQDQSDEPVWEIGRYTPSTRPGSRAPHVFLEDGKTSMYDLLGSGFTLVQFEYSGSESLCLESGIESSYSGDFHGKPEPHSDASGVNNTNLKSQKDTSNIFLSTASSRGIPLKRVYIKGQRHARRIWERELVLVRPDTHVAWRGDCAEVSRLGEEGVYRIWDIVTGHAASPLTEKNPATHIANERAFEEIVTGFLGAEMRGRDELGIQY